MKIGEDISRIPAGEFLLKTGLLFEINRKILHPFGLALEVVEQEDEMRQMHVVVSEGLLDLRSDPEGIIFGERAFIEGKNRLNKFLDEYGRQKLLLRKEKLGSVVQHQEFDYIDSDSMYNINKAKLDASVPVTKASTDTAVVHNGAIPALQISQPADDESKVPGTEHLSVAERNAILRAKNKISARQGRLTDVHNTPDGEPCTNPVITKEPLPGGGYLTVCDTCGATLQDSDLVQ